MTKWLMRTKTAIQLRKKNRSIGLLRWCNRHQVGEASRLSRFLVIVQSPDCFARSEAIFVICEFLLTDG